ncbi:MAG: branched-chain amino acid ABC transporter permease [Candidatus Caldarchaeum sp.]
MLSGSFLTDALVLYLLYTGAAQVWGFMARHAGLISLGQQIFIGVGGYATVVVTMYYGLPMWISVLAAGFFGAVLAAALSIPLLRFRGMYFAISTLLSAEVLKLFFNSWEFVGAGKGLIFKEAYGVTSTVIYYSALGVSLFTVFLLYFIYHSKLGFGLRAIGSDEDAASTVGVNTFYQKSLLFTVSSFVIALIGALNAVNRTYLHPTAAFNISWTVDFVFIAVIGGIGRLVGPLIGGLVFISLRYILAQYLGLSLLLEGLIVFTLLLVAPDGLWGFVTRKLKIKVRPPL